MLALRSERLLAQLFQDVAQAEERVEAQRESLALTAAFTPDTVFPRMDRYGLGSIDAADLVRYLDSLGLYLRESEARLIIKQYDSNADGRLSEQDFLQLALPAANPTVRNLALERRAGIYSTEVTVALTRLFELELAYHRGLLDNARDLRLQDDFTISAAFNAAALPLSNYVTRASLRSLLGRHGPQGSEAALDAIFRRLDTDGDERLTYSEFSFPFTELPRPEPSYSSSALPLDRSSRSSRSLRNPDLLSRSQADFNRSMRSSGSVDPEPRLSSRSLRSSRSISKGALRTSYADLGATRSLRSSYAADLGATRSFRSTISSPRYESYGRSAGGRLALSARDALAAYFQEKLAFLREADIRRRELSLDYDFNLEDAFRMFDRYDKGYLTAIDLEEGIYALGGNPRPGEVRLLVTEFSAGAYSKLSFADFCDMILPSGIRRYGAQSLYPADRRSPFRLATKNHLLDLLQLLLDTEKRTEAQRQALQRLPTYTAIDAFAALDQDRDNNLTSSELRYFLESSGLRATERELQALVAGLDRDRDGRVTSREFADALSPRAVERYY
jgi:Ca2+-binding EF-hand superfamily protein